jgi:hypothetical protein
MAVSRKTQRESVLIFGEGAKDRAWLIYLVSQFSDLRIKFIRVKCGYGGSPKDVIYGALQQFGDFNKRVVIIDGDKPKAEYIGTSELAAKHNLVLIIVKPCMEALLLQILQPRKKWRSKPTKTCIQTLEKIIPRTKQVNSRAYGRHFSKKKIMTAVNKNKELKAILKLISPRT